MINLTGQGGFAARYRPVGNPVAYTATAAGSAANTLAATPAGANAASFQPKSGAVWYRFNSSPASDGSDAVSIPQGTIVEFRDREIPTLRANSQTGTAVSCTVQYFYRVN